MKSHLLLSAWIGIAAIGAVARAADSMDDRSRVLELISLEYRIAGKDHPRTHELAPYKPLYDSAVPGVAPLAKLSTLWELAALRSGQTHKQFVSEVEDFLGFDAQGRISPGAIKRFVGVETHESAFGELLRVQDDRYAQLVLLAQTQDVLWDRAEALARSGAGAGSLDPKQLEITFQPRKGVGYVVVVRNRSLTPHNALTLAVGTKVKPLPPASPGGDMLLGGLAAALVGEDDAGELAKSAAAFASAAANQRKFHERPYRVFVHVPELPAGTACEAMLLRDALQLVRCEAATYSLWSPSVTVEGQAVPQFVFQATKARKKMEDDAKKAAKARAKLVDPRLLPPVPKSPPPKRKPAR